ncbi:MAG: hypothetical protein ACYTEK_17860 [Planctomycetota bacterium]|jgi:hypothetical protein
MTKLLSDAFEKASQLPENLQDELARMLLDELTWEKRWDRTLARSSSKLDEMAEDALKDHRAGRTKEMGFDEL